MKKLNIIKSNTEPDKNNLWLKDGEIKEFNGSWKSITSNKENSAQGNSGMLVFSSLEEAQSSNVKDGEIVSIYSPNTIRSVDISEITMTYKNNSADVVYGDCIHKMSELYVDQVSSFANKTSMQFMVLDRYVYVMLNPQTPFKIYYTISGLDEDFVFEVPSARPWAFPEDIGLGNGADTYLLKITQGDISIQRNDLDKGLSLSLLNLLEDIKKLGWLVTVGESESMSIYKKVNSEFSKLALDSFLPITYDLTSFMNTVGTEVRIDNMIQQCAHTNTVTQNINFLIPAEFDYIQGAYIYLGENTYYCPVVDRNILYANTSAYPKRITFRVPNIIAAYDNHSSLEVLNGDFFIRIIQVSEMAYPILAVSRDINPTLPDIVFYAHGSLADKNIAVSNILAPDKNYVCAIVGNDVHSKVYNIVGNYYNGVITAFTEGKIKKYEMSSSTGYITEISTFNVNTDPYTSYVEAGGSKTESEFYTALKALIDA